MLASNADWLTPINLGTSVDYVVAANTTPTARSAILAIGTAAVTVNQAAGGTTITIATSPAGLQVSIDGGSAQIAPVTVSLPQGSHSIAVVTPQAGAAGSQYVFTSWSDGGTATTDQITVGAGSATYTATFKTQFQLTISALPAAGGTVLPASGFFDSGAVVPLSATAQPSYSFTGWSGPVVNGSNASTTVTMLASEVVTANFAPVTSTTIQTNPAGLNFTIDGGAAQIAPQTLNLSEGNHTLAVATTQPNGAGTQEVFANWSDGGAASHSINATGSASTYTANFQTQYQLTIAASPAAGGMVTPASGGFYNAAAVVPVAATANVGYTFTGWSGTVARARRAPQPA